VLEDHLHQGRLGEDHIGVTVLDVFIGGTKAIMSHETWSIAECSFPSGRSLHCTIDHFIALHVTKDPDAHFGGRRKEPYRFLVRKENLNTKDSQFIRKTSDVEIWKINSGRCGPKHCCQLFPHVHTFTVKQRFYLKSFEDQQEYGILAGGQMHFIQGDRKHHYQHHKVPTD
jgi:hypothetical protein